jgi:hypothetical protein
VSYNLIVKRAISYVLHGKKFEPNEIAQFAAKMSSI